jgi:DNA-binding transcriptional regulator YiaG
MPKKTPTKSATVGADLIEGMKLVLAHQRGEIELDQVWPKPIDVKAIRKRVKMSQNSHARIASVSALCRNGSREGVSQTRPRAHI